MDSNTHQFFAKVRKASSTNNTSVAQDLGGRVHCFCWNSADFCWLSLSFNGTKQKTGGYQFQVPSQTTLPETNSSHLKVGLPKRKLVFQPSIFRGYVSFREGNNPNLWKNLDPSTWMTGKLMLRDWKRSLRVSGPSYHIPFKLKREVLPVHEVTFEWYDMTGHVRIAESFLE